MYAVDLKDIQELQNWLLYISTENINYQHFDIMKWYEELKNITREELVNGFKNFLKYKEMHDHSNIYLFPITPKQFKNLCFKH